ncbi:MAG: hypothetical protein H6562_04735 [Lewinellaceae bacterium]|nr:hypothetical protein [Lewinellaceae bacterium]
MDQPSSIKRIPPADKSMDFDFLRKEAIRYAQQLSGDSWTDYNEHDPGVTLLEYLAFAITDLGYRTAFDIKDLLYARENKKAPAPEFLLKNGKEPPINAFFGPSAILPAGPLIESDYRRLIIDRCNHLVKNAWFQPVTDQEQGYKGLYRVLVQLAEDYNPENDSEALQEIRHLLARYRNLCEDIEEVRVLQSEPVTVFADVYLMPDAFGEYVLAEIIFALEEYLSPSIPFYQPDELLEMGWDINEIFEGPLPLYGFIRPADLRPLESAVIVSQLRDLVAGTAGVRSVNNLYLRKKGARVYGDEVEIDPGTYLVLSKKEMISPEAVPYPVRLIKDGEEVPVNFSQVLRIYHTMAAKKRKISRLPQDFEEAAPVSGKDLAKVREYFSFQRLLPGVYGVGNYGLPEVAGRQRKAQASQLKGYLLVFEQLLANYLSQLAGVRHLFSLSEDVKATYFAGFPFDIPDVLHLQNFVPDAEDLPPGEAMRVIQESMRKWTTENFDPGAGRRNRFLDHLLGRFGEIFTGDHLRALFKEESNSGMLKKALIRTKIRFLQQYPELSRDRSIGFNYREPAWENDNISTLKKRICLFLDIKNQQNCSLTAGLELFEKTEEAPKKGSLLPMKTMLRLGWDEHRYKITPDGERWKLILITNPDPAAAGNLSDEKDVIPLYSGQSKQDCEQARVRLMEQLGKFNAGSEGFFIVEHLLLRPKRASGFKLVYRAEGEYEGIPLVFKSIDFQPSAELNRVLNDLVFLGTVFMNDTGAGRSDTPEFPNSNYLLLEAREGGYYLLLLRKHTPVLIAGREEDTEKGKTVRILPFRTRSEARQAILNAMDHLQTLKGNPSGIADFTDFEPEPLSGLAHIERDFYSHRLSFVLPDWPTYFQDPDYRQLFEQTVRLNIPVHLSIQFKWLGFKQMQAFEKTFQSWLEVKTADSADPGKADDLSLELLRYLHPSDDIESRIAGSRAEKTAAATPLRFFKAAYSHPDLRFSYFLRENDLQAIDGIGPETEGILKSAGVRSWIGLAVKKEDDLLELFTAAKFKIGKQDVQYWKQQAKAAAEGNWNSLIKLQRSKIEQEEAAGVIRPGNQPQAEKRAFIRFVARFDTTDLTLFEGIDEAVEKQLRDAGIQSWSDLANARNQRILEKVNPEKSQSWKAQAESALRAIRGDREDARPPQRKKKQGKNRTDQ